MGDIRISFEMDLDDDYDKMCGKIFLTIKGNLIFHCSLCDYKYKNFYEYESHAKSHLPLAYFNDEDEEYPIIEESDYTSNETNEQIDNPVEEVVEIELVLENEQTNLESGNDDSTNDDTRHMEGPSLTRRKAIQENDIPKERKFICKICGFAFTEDFNLRAHVRRHTSKKNYNCSMCPKSFHTRTELETHIRRHNGERPFICEECGQTFVTGGALTMHMKRHKNIRNHECPHCKKRFFDSHALKLHVVGHTGERPFQCTECNAAFSRKKALAVHIKIHENKREYQCQYCNASFNQKPGLYSHIKIKHNKST